MPLMICQKWKPKEEVFVIFPTQLQSHHSFSQLLPSLAQKIRVRCMTTAKSVEMLPLEHTRRHKWFNWVMSLMSFNFPYRIFRGINYCNNSPSSILPGKSFFFHTFHVRLTGSWNDTPTPCWFIGGGIEKDKRGVSTH